MTVDTATTVTTIRSIVSCETLSNVTDSILDPLVRLLNADSAVYLQIQSDDYHRPVIQHSSYTGGCPKILEQYKSDFFDEDPVLNPIIGRPERWKQYSSPVEIQLSRQVKPSELRETDFFRSFLHPNNLGDVLGLVVPIDLDGLKMHCVGVHRSEQSPRFTEQHNAALASISGPLQMVLQNLSLKNVVDEQAALLQLLDKSDLNVEFAVLDRKLQLKRASHRFREVFRTLTPDSDEFTHLRAAARELEYRLTQDSEVRTAIELFGNCYAELSSLTVGSELYFVLVTPFQGSYGESSLPPFALKNDFALTRREREVVEQVASGQSNAQVSSTLGISIRTVENHLRAIFYKLGVNSRTQLIHRIYHN
ncbi:response regulator transcription factor [Haliea salexigens]|uniref:response regulator transcription factor n=1 Tax=Haliea salexigens TaxID=287487 RepID=UPI000409DA3F|nr:helix-turn-helix transcriptional regulator [Haliea salexigens]